MQLVLASNNAKKLLELQALLSGLAVQLVAQSALQITEADEPHGTFVENALAKARHAAAHANGPAIADDSGLCVDALGGEPGVASAHYADAVPDGGDREQRRVRQDAANTALLLQRMRDATDRRARFVSTLVALRHAARSRAADRIRPLGARIAARTARQRWLRLRPGGARAHARLQRRRTGARGEKPDQPPRAGRARRCAC